MKKSKFFTLQRLKSINLVFLVAFFVSALFPINAANVDQLDQVIGKAVQNIWSQIQKEQPIWNLPPWLGTLFISEYYFQLKALNMTGDLKLKTQFDINFFKQKLIDTQLEDGSWIQVIDANKKQGLLDATIFNYWYLKDVGLQEKSETMKKARKFVLDHGGIQNSQVMTRFKLATFGQYEWHLLPYIPLFIYKNYSPFTYFKSYIKDYVAQWVYPHMLPLTYLRYHKTVFPVSKVCLSELRISRSDHCQQIMKIQKLKWSQKNQANNQSQKTQKKTQIVTADFDVDNIFQEAIKIKGPKGLYGAYTISTLLILLSFKDYSMRYDNHSDFAKFYEATHLDSLKFVEQIYFNRLVPYQGSLVDGRYWDTLLSSFALLEAGQSPLRLEPTIQFLIKNAVQQNGGIPYGLQLQYAPDIDDTSILLILYGRMKSYYQKSGNTQKIGFYQKEIQRTYGWLKTTQNQDGGFPAFDKDKNDNQYKILKWVFRLIHLDKSAQIFDPSCADIVGHLLESFAETEKIESTQELNLIFKSIRFLIQTKQSRMWSARWGINYVYAVGAAIPGLARIGFDLNDFWVTDVINRLKQVQHSDGGFGQDSESYNQHEFINGVSTVSMTAWGLLAYLQVADFMEVDDNIKRAVDYIVRNFQANGNKFFDRSVVGTGHRGLLNLQYPVYAYSFPLIAISRAREYLKGKRVSYLNPKLNQAFRKFNSSFVEQLL